MNKALYILILILGLYGCNSETSIKMNETLYRAESCMEASPDSALLLLRSIPRPEELKGKARADYALLYSQACDKNRISVTNDSLAQIAVDYYGHKNGDLRAARSYFYLGCVYRNADRSAPAIEAYLKALDKMPREKPHKLWMQLYFNLGEQYHYQNLYGSSMEMYRKCLTATEELKDTSLLFFPYRGIARTYLFEDKNDSALIYYQEALNISRFVRNDYWEAIILGDMGKAYLYQGDTLQAERFITSSIQKNKSVNTLYFKSKLLYYRNELDSAKNLLLEECQSNDLYTKASRYNLLYQIEKKLQNHPYAYAYNDSFNLYRDSIETLEQYQDIHNLHVKHAIELQQKEVERKAEKIFWIICSILVILLSAGLCLYLYLRKRYKEYLLRKRILFLNDQNLTIGRYLESRLEQKIPLIEVVTSFKKEQLQKGIDAFNASSWKARLDEAERRIKSGDYIKPDEQKLLYQELDICFKDFTTDITRIYPKMSREDVYYCILSGLRYKVRTIMYAMCCAGGTLRTRKSRLKKNMAEDTFLLLFHK